MVTKIITANGTILVNHEPEAQEIEEPETENETPWECYLNDLIENYSHLSSIQMAEDMKTVYGNTCSYWLGVVENFKAEDDEYWKEYFATP